MNISCNPAAQQHDDDCRNPPPSAAAAQPCYYYYHRSRNMMMMAPNKHTAARLLLVVGMQNDKLSAMAWGGEEASLRRDGAVPATPAANQFRAEVNSCIAFAAASGWKIAYVLDVHHPKHSSFQGHGGAMRQHCVLSTWGCNPVSGMHFGMRGSELIIRGVDTDGDSADAFCITTTPQNKDPTCLRALLAKKKAPLLVVCGASPDGCIENTAASALEMGFRVCAVEKALWLRAGVALPHGVRRASSVNDV